MTCGDWRGSTPAEATALLAAEARVWLDDLNWDVSTAWRVIEPARRAGQLPGFVVRDRSGRLIGWTSFLPHRGSLHVFALVAERPGVVRELVDAILGSADAERAQAIVVCVRSASTVLSRTLLERGFLVEPYRYLSKVLVDEPGSPPAGLGRWIDHTDAMARLCAGAYRDAPGVRAFALDGSMDAWEEYIAGLVAGPGCGRFAPDLSFVVPRGDDELEAAVLVTRLGPGVIHVAQLAVDPASRGRHLGTRLIRAVECAGRSQGATEVTLLVAATNRPAVSLYEGRGFQDRAKFVVATRHQPSLSTSLALDTGGDSTRL